MVLRKVLRLDREGSVGVQPRKMLRASGQREWHDKHLGVRNTGRHFDTKSNTAKQRVRGGESQDRVMKRTVGSWL